MSVSVIFFLLTIFLLSHDKNRAFTDTFISSLPSRQGLSYRHNDGSSPGILYSGKHDDDSSSALPSSPSASSFSRGGHDHHEDHEGQQTSINSQESRNESKSQAKSQPKSEISQNEEDPEVVARRIASIKLDPSIEQEWYSKHSRALINQLHARKNKVLVCSHGS